MTLANAILTSLRSLMRSHNVEETTQTVDTMYYTVTRDGEWIRLNEREIEAIKAAESQTRQSYV